MREGDLSYMHGLINESTIKPGVLIYCLIQHPQIPVCFIHSGSAVNRDTIYQVFVYTKISSLQATTHERSKIKRQTHTDPLIISLHYFQMWNVFSWILVIWSKITFVTNHLCYLFHVQSKPLTSQQQTWCKIYTDLVPSEAYVSTTDMVVDT